MTHLCKHCQMMIFPNILYKEENTQGFCGKICKRLWDDEKRFQLERAQKEVDDAIARTEGRP